jgi:hypothetical protein
VAVVAAVAHTMVELLVVVVLVVALLEIVIRERQTLEVVAEALEKVVLLSLVEEMAVQEL